MNLERTLEAFIASLAGARDWSRQLGQIREWAAETRTDVFHGLAKVLTGSSCPDRVAPVVRRSLLEELIRSLALSPAEAAAEGGANPSDQTHISEGLRQRRAPQTRAAAGTPTRSAAAVDGRPRR
jgi:hypothetical protein